MEGLQGLPEGVKGRILSFLLQPKPPAPPTKQESTSAARLPGSVHAQLRGKSISHGPVVLDGFVRTDTAQALLDEAKQLIDEKARVAGMGGAAADAKWADNKYRGDTIVFLRPERLAAEGYPALSSLLPSLEAQLRPWLEAQGYDVSGKPTFQLGCYPGGGARYVRHRDASLTCAYRTVTALLYLNPGWRPEDGGELCVYHLDTTPPNAPLPAAAPSAAAAAATAEAEAAPQRQVEAPAVRSGLEEGHAATVVPPIAGRLAVFDSRTEHEVLPGHAPRFAVTTWFTRGEGQGGSGAAREVALAAEPSQEAAAQQGQGRQQEAPDGVRGPGSAVAEQREQQSQSQQQQEQQQGQQQGQQQQQQQQQQGQQEQQQGQGQEQVPGQQPVQAGSGASGSPRPPATQAAAPAVRMGMSAQQAAPPLDMCCISQPGRIYVSIASYRDSETQWTLRDLFQKAEWPEQISVGVVWQVDWARDSHFVRMAPGAEAWQRQVRQVILDAGEATGPCKARALAQQLWDGEEFYLQVDSHMRFAAGWDTQLLRMLCQAEQHAGHPRVVLSAYPPGYQGEGEEASLPANPSATLLCATHFDQDGLLRIKGRALRAAPAAPLPSLFWAAGLSFSRAQLFTEAPYDPSLPFLFFGEEMLHLLRLFQRGWDVYAPCTPVAFHLWCRSYRPTFQKGAGVGSSSSSSSNASANSSHGARGGSGSGSGYGGTAEHAVGAEESNGSLPKQQSPTARRTAAALRRRSQQHVLQALCGAQGTSLPPPPLGAAQQPQQQGAALGPSSSVPLHAAGSSHRHLPRGATEEAAGPAALMGGGQQRSLAQFYSWCGVDFRRQVISERALWGGCTPGDFLPSWQDLLGAQQEQQQGQQQEPPGLQQHCSTTEQQGQRAAPAR